MLRILKASKSRILGGLETISNRIKWIYFSPDDADRNLYAVHMLVSKKNDYSQIARVCVESFLYFHPKAAVIIHCDSITFGTTCRKLTKVAKHKNVEIILDQDDEETWQQQKINLILQISGSDDFFMDADLKWNGAMTSPSGVCFFVEEYVFESNRFYREFLPKLGIAEQLHNSMKNTSFFTWGGNKLNQDKQEQLLNFIDNFENSLNLIDIDSSQKKELLRIVEQLGLSLIIDRGHCSFLKKADSQFDGTFVESSYFGATQTKFGNFGVTSRKY
jgi:hypothetical protein